MATYKKYIDENGNTIYEEIKELPKENTIEDIRQRVVQQNANEQYWEELDRRNKATKKANLKIKLFWLVIAFIGLITVFISLFKFQNFYVMIAGLIIMGLGGMFIRNKYSEY